MRRYLTGILKLVFALALVGWIYQRGSLDFSLLARLFDPVHLVPVLLLTLLPILVANFRWMILLQCQGVEAPFKKTAPLTFIGIFFNYAMPGGVGGDLIKGFYLVRSQAGNKIAAASSIVVDRLIGFYVMTLMGLLALAFRPELMQSRPQVVILALSLLGLFITFSGFFAAAFSKRIRNHRWIEGTFLKLPAGDKILKIYDAVHSYRTNLKQFALACILSAISQTMIIAFFVYVGGQFGGDQIAWETYAFVVPLGLIATAIPISPAGLGVGQVAFDQLFIWCLGQATPVGATIITAHQLTGFVWGLVGAYFYFRRGRSTYAEVPA